MIGRRGELAELRHRLTREQRLVTVTGPAGIGKSRLAREAAAELQRAFPGGVRVLGLEQVSSGHGLVPAVAGVLGAPLTGAPDAFAPLVAAVGDRELLLLLDGCDHVVEPCGELVATMLARCPSLRVLVTSRQVLQVEGESVLTLGALGHPTPGDRPVTAAEAEEYDAVALFVARARRLVPSFELDDVNAPAVAAITGTLDGVPLAVELAAARVAVLSPHAILERLSAPYRLLTKGDPDAPPRSRSLEASVSLSAGLCTEQERELWARMSVFAGTFGIEAVESVCSGDGIDLPTVLDLVDGLLERSVLAREGSDPVEVRYRLLEPLRDYGAQLLGERAGRWRSRHRQWCVELLEEAAAGWFGPGQRTWLQRLRREHVELVAALGRALAEPAEEVEPGRLVGGVVSLAAYWTVVGRLAEARQWLMDAAERFADPRLRAEALLGTGWCAVLQSDTASAVAARAAAGPIGSGDPARLRQLSLRLDGGVAIAQGRYAAAREHLAELVRSARATGHQEAEAAALLLQGVARSLGRDPAAAAAALRGCLERTEAAGEWWIRSQCLTVLAAAALVEGEPQVADRAAREALAVAAELGDGSRCGAVTGPRFLLELLGCAAAEVGQPERAATLLGAAAGQGHPGWPPEEWWRTAAARSRAAGRARAALGKRRYDASRRRGEGLSTGEAVRFALDGVLAEPEQSSAREDTLLTARELEVAGLVADGLSNRDIAERLVISARTAQGHVENILRKLGFGSRAQVAAWVAAGAHDARRP